MKIRYKVSIHVRKGKKNETHISYLWKNKKSDKYGVVQIDYCCKSMETATAHGFITVELSQYHFVEIKHEERQIKLKEPLVCLYSMNESGYGNDGCPHEEMVLPITNCPFCTEKIEYECVEKKRVTHECIKIKKEYEECEDKITEEIL